MYPVSYLLRGGQGRAPQELLDTISVLSLLFLIGVIILILSALVVYWLYTGS
jgi:hypothetical protein